MGDTEEPIRQPGLAADCLAMSTLREKYYRPLVRLAALLTGDVDAAEAVACDVLTGLRPTLPSDPEPSEDVLRSLQEQVVVRSRRRRPPVPAEPNAADFARLPVVRALQELPRRGREAVVLTYYLDLSEQRAASVAGVTPTALRRFLRQAMRALDNQFPAA